MRLDVFTAEQQDFRQVVRSFFWPRRSNRTSPTGSMLARCPRQLYRRLGELGIIGLGGIPRGVRGGGGDKAITGSMSFCRKRSIEPH